MRYTLLTLLVGIVSTSTGYAGPQPTDRLQLTLEADTVTPDLVTTLTQRAEAYATFRNLGPVQVRHTAPDATTILMEFPLAAGQAAQPATLQEELRTLLTRKGGLELTWDVGSSVLDALHQLQKHIGVGRVSTRTIPHLTFDNTIRLTALEKTIAKVAPPSGIRWMVDKAVPKKQKTGPVYVVYAIADPGFINDRAVASVSIEKSLVGPSGLIVNFTPDAARILASETKKRIGKRLIILFEDRVQSALTVRDSVTSGRIRLDLGYMFSRGPSPGEVERLAATMNSGKLDTPVRLINARVLKRVTQ